MLALQPWEAPCNHTWLLNAISLVIFSLVIFWVAFSGQMVTTLQFSPSHFEKLSAGLDQKAPSAGWFRLGGSSWPCRRSGGGCSQAAVLLLVVSADKGEEVHRCDHTKHHLLHEGTAVSIDCKHRKCQFSGRKKKKTKKPPAAVQRLLFVY